MWLLSGPLFLVTVCLNNAAWSCAVYLAICMQPDPCTSWRQCAFPALDPGVPAMSLPLVHCKNSLPLAMHAW